MLLSSGVLRGEDAVASGVLAGMAICVIAALGNGDDSVGAGQSVGTENVHMDRAPC